MLMDEPFAALDANLRLDPDLAAIPRIADRQKAAGRPSHRRRTLRPAARSAALDNHDAETIVGRAEPAGMVV